jgi:hypothetical protein
MKQKFLRHSMNKTDELRTARIDSLVTPAELAQRHPVSAALRNMLRPPAAALKKSSTVKTSAFWW